MGMDVNGNSGNYFRNNWWWWIPLAEYCFEVGEAVCLASNHCNHWSYNHGSMTAYEASALSRILQAEIDSGRTSQYAAARLIRIDALPDQPCSHCNGTGWRHERRFEGTVMSPGHPDPSPEAKPWQCNACAGIGTKRPWEASYPFSVDNIQEWANFLILSEGFELS